MSIFRTRDGITGAQPMISSVELSDFFRVGTVFCSADDSSRFPVFRRVNDFPFFFDAAILQSQAAGECHCERSEASRGFGDCFPAERGTMTNPRAS
jgi:hypothetical protein